MKLVRTWIMMILRECEVSLKHHYQSLGINRQRKWKKDFWVLPCRTAFRKTLRRDSKSMPRLAPTARSKVFRSEGESASKLTDRVHVIIRTMYCVLLSLSLNVLNVINSKYYALCYGNCWWMLCRRRTVLNLHTKKARSVRRQASQLIRGIINASGITIVGIINASRLYIRR